MVNIVKNPKYKDEDWVCLPWTRTVVMPDMPISETRYMVYLLHEFGHIYYNHPPTITYDWKVYFYEMQAWHYVYRCIKPKYHPLVDKYREECLETYRVDWGWYDRLLAEHKMAQFVRDEQ